MNPAAEPDLLPITTALRRCFLRVGYDADGVLGLLGSAAHAAMGRGEPVPARRASQSSGQLGTLVRLLLLGDTIDEVEASTALAPLPLAAALTAGLLEQHGDGVRAALDVRPVDTGAGTRWLVSDLDADLRPHPATREHVPGVGQSSLSLLRATPTVGVGTVLDLGTGCGVQAVHATEYAQRVTGTDVSPRALAMAAATCAVNELTVELLGGSWFEPVAGRTFDQVVANPPFVVGPPRVHYTYRDSGLDLDGASELVVRGAPEHLVLGGTATVLASWVHLEGQDWRSRVASWVAPHGVDAWVVQRDVADPALYVGTWLRDAGVEPRSPEGAARAKSWLEHLERSGVVAIGFGYITLRRTELLSDVLCEDLTHGFEDPLGDEAPQYLARLDWLRGHDLLGSTFVVAPGTALQRVSVAAADGGWEQVVVRLHRGGGPAWQHETDDLGAALLAGMRPGGLPLGQLVQLLEVAHGEPTDALVAGAVELVDGLVRHGLVLPQELV